MVLSAIRERFGADTSDQDGIPLLGGFAISDSRKNIASRPFCKPCKRHWRNTRKDVPSRIFYGDLGDFFHIAHFAVRAILLPLERCGGIRSFRGRSLSPISSRCPALNSYTFDLVFTLEKAPRLSIPISVSSIYVKSYYGTRRRTRISIRPAAYFALPSNRVPL